MVCVVKRRYKKFNLWKGLKYLVPCKLWIKENIYVHLVIVIIKGNFYCMMCEYIIIYLTAAVLPQKKSCFGIFNSWFHFFTKG